MNLQKKSIGILTIFAAALFSFTEPVIIERPAVTYNVDPSQSELVWKGKKVTGEHTGTIDLEKGSIITDGNTILGGEFIFDMSSIKNTDLTDPENNKKLVDHLKSDDFFSTETHRTSSFNIKEITPKGDNVYDVKGDLTIKGITQEISFPATIKERGNDLIVNGNVVIDRSKFNVRFGSGSFFQNLGDNLIYDDFELDLNIVAEKLEASIK